jgi:DNA-binding PadR family transcriptional regulator
LQDQQFITLTEEENGRKKIEITLAGQQWLDENLEQLSDIQSALKRAAWGSSCVKTRR